MPWRVIRSIGSQQVHRRAPPVLHQRHQRDPRDAEHPGRHPAGNQRVAHRPRRASCRERSHGPDQATSPTHGYARRPAARVRRRRCGWTAWAQGRGHHRFPDPDVRPGNAHRSDGGDAGGRATAPARLRSRTACRAGWQRASPRIGARAAQASKASGHRTVLRARCRALRHSHDHGQPGADQHNSRSAHRVGRRQTSRWLQGTATG